MPRTHRPFRTLTATLASLALAAALVPAAAVSALAATVTSTALSSSDAATLTVTDNASENNYTPWPNKTARSFVCELDSNSTLGAYMRVECDTSADGDSDTTTADTFVVEYYDSEWNLTSTKTYDTELDVWGGFFFGEEYSFVVVGQDNEDSDDATEVLRIIKYDREMTTRLDSTSYYGANTTEPFEWTNLNMTEDDGNLYVYTGHMMYNSHEANMGFIIDEETLETVDCFYGADTYSGYCSHALYQLIRTDGEYVYRCDLVDDYVGIYERPSLNVSRNPTGQWNDNTYTAAITFPAAGVYTGCSPSGMELSDDNVIVVGKSVDYENSRFYRNNNTQRNIFVSVTDKDFTLREDDSELIYLTDYEGDDVTADDTTTSGTAGSSEVGYRATTDVRTPQLVKITDDRFLVMWEEADIEVTEATDGTKTYTTTDDVTVQMVLINGSGTVISCTESADMRLSDCQPILTSSGSVMWYVSDGTDVTLYTVDPDSLDEGCVTGVSLSDTASNTVALSGDSEELASWAAGDVEVTVEAWEDNASVYSLETDETLPTVTLSSDGSTVSVTGATQGIFEVKLHSVGEADVVFTVYVDSSGTVTKLIADEMTDFLMSYATITFDEPYVGDSSFLYEGSTITPSITVTLGSAVLSADEYTVTYSDNDSCGTATVTITGSDDEHWSTTATAEFSIGYDLSTCTVTANTSSYIYSGKTYTPGVTVTTSDDETVASSNYTLKYADNTDVGTATITLTGKGDYLAATTNSATFSIVEPAETDAYAPVEIVLVDGSLVIQASSSAPSDFDLSAYLAAVETVIYLDSSGGYYTCSLNTQTGVITKTLSTAGTYRLVVTAVGYQTVRAYFSCDSSGTFSGATVTSGTADVPQTTAAVTFSVSDGAVSVVSSSSGSDAATSAYVAAITSVVATDASGATYELSVSSDGTVDTSSLTAEGSYTIAVSATGYADVTTTLTVDSTGTVTAVSTGSGSSKATVKVKKKSLKAKAKKTVKFKASSLYKISGSPSSKSFALGTVKKGKKKLKKAKAKKIKVAKKTGVITVKKGLAKGSYTLAVKVKLDGKTTTLTYKLKVK